MWFRDAGIVLSGMKWIDGFCCMVWCGMVWNWRMGVRLCVYKNWQKMHSHVNSMYRFIANSFAESGNGGISHGNSNSNSNGCWIGSLALSLMVCHPHVIVYISISISLFWFAMVRSCTDTNSRMVHTVRGSSVRLLAFVLRCLSFDFQPIYKLNDAISTEVQIKVNNIPVCSIHCDFSAWVCLQHVVLYFCVVLAGFVSFFCFALFCFVLLSVSFLYKWCYFAGCFFFFLWTAFHFGIFRYNGKISLTLSTSIS